MQQPKKKSPSGTYNHLKQVIRLNGKFQEKHDRPIVLHVFSSVKGANVTGKLQCTTNNAKFLEVFSRIT